jgi:DNA-binding winged helix-turn-helix (wHTH) protein
VARYRFGAFEADAGSGELLRAGRVVPLAPQPFRALMFLLERAGEVVSRDELKGVLWTEGTFVEFDQGLNFTIGRLRQALGDDARSPRFLETVPRRGYRCVTPVERVVEPTQPRPFTEVPAAAGPPRRRSRC